MLKRTIVEADEGAYALIHNDLWNVEFVEYPEVKGIRKRQLGRNAVLLLIRYSRFAVTILIKNLAAFPGE